MESLECPQRLSSTELEGDSGLAEASSLGTVTAATAPFAAPPPRLQPVAVHLAQVAPGDLSAS